MSARVVILDTNMIHNPSVFDSLAYRALKTVCNTAGIELGIVSVTLDESINKQVENAREAISQLEKSSRTLGAILNLNTYIPDVEQVRDQWKETLTDQLKIYSVDGNDAIEALRREALRIAPAKQGGRGSRDCAIWLTVLRIAREGRQVYFVTNNSSDFGTAPTLLKELNEEVNRESLQVIYVSSFQQLLEEISDEPVDPGSIVIEDPVKILSQSLKLQLLDYFQGADDRVTRDEVLDAPVQFSEVVANSAYKVGTSTLASMDFTFAMPISANEESSKLAGKAQAFVNFDNEFNDFRIADPADIKVLSVEAVPAD